MLSASSSADAPLQFTCLTCRVTFAEADPQRLHYKSDWHRYNLKRKVAQMAPVSLESFQSRQAAQQEEMQASGAATGHQVVLCEACQKHFSSQNAFENHVKSARHKQMIQRRDTDKSDRDSIMSKEEKATREHAGEKGASRQLVKVKAESVEAVQPESSATSVDDVTMEDIGSDQEDAELGLATAGEINDSGAEEEADAENGDSDEDNRSDGSWESYEGGALGVEECLFCSRISRSMLRSIQHMCREHSFFIPDVEYLVDVEGLLSLLGEKVGEHYKCLWCGERGRKFQSVKAAQRHMVDKGHCKLLTDGDAALEFADFYDYTRKFMPEETDGTEGQTSEGNPDAKPGPVPTVALTAEDGEDACELVLPSGSKDLKLFALRSATIGHRSLMRYYRQNLIPRHTTAVQPASRKRVARVIAQYKAIGWSSNLGEIVSKKQRDLAFVQRLKARHHLDQGMRSNKQPRHIRARGLAASYV